jgi:lipoate-protein ligase A
MNSAASPWPLHEWNGSATDFHALDLPYERAVWWCRVSEAALILGSTQSEEDVNLEAASAVGISIARRRSGGGAVFVHPNDSIWIDVTIPRDDPLWVDDVATSMMWLGRSFVAALQPWLHTKVFPGAFDAGRDGRAVCFASSSPGEVFVGDQKLVGISQRRGREGARFQCVLYRAWHPSEWALLLSDVSVAERLEQLSVAVVDADPRAVVAAVSESLPR